MKEERWVLLPTYLCCVDANIGLREICEKHNYEMGMPKKVMLIQDTMYVCNYIIYNTYNKEGLPFRLQLTNEQLLV